MSASLALVGDYSPAVLAHRAIPRALELACVALDVNLSWTWLRTRELVDAPRQLAPFAGVWLVPASPYENTAAALAAARFARETSRPFLGTCGGFQHAVIDFARAAAGLADADHAETNPDAGTLVITPLTCSLVECTGDVHFAPGSLLQEAYGAPHAHEGYHCNYGVNPTHRATLEQAGLRFTALASDGGIRGAELPRAAHPFFAGTLFQPERAALRDVLPPLVRAFVAAVAAAPHKRA